MYLRHILLDTLFQRHCFNCETKLDWHIKGFICDNCFKQFLFNNNGSCICCGRSNGIGKNTICVDCVEKKPFFTNGISLFAFNGVGKNFIHTLKYRNGVYLKQDIVRIIEHERNRMNYSENTVFVPVPLHFVKKWKRGYNQSEFIAKALAGFFNCKCLSILKRVHNTKSQTTLTKKDRINNIIDAFAIKNIKFDKTKQYVLVDDVFTTGATLNECAKILHENGVCDIGVFTLAHG